MKKKFRIVEKYGIVIYDESDDYDPREGDPDMDDDDENFEYEHKVIDDDDFDDVNEYVPGAGVPGMENNDIDMEYFMKHAVEEKPSNIDPNSPIVTALVVLGCIAIIALCTVCGIWLH